MPDKTLVHLVNGKTYCWIRCEETYVLMVCEENHLKYEWSAKGEVILRKVYEQLPEGWAAVVFTGEGKLTLGSRPTKEEAWALVEEAYSSMTVQSPSDGANNTSWVVRDPTVR